MKQLNIWSAAASLLLTVSSCAHMDLTMPRGEKGDQGMSSYEVWVASVADGTLSWDKNATSVADYFKFIKGTEGKAGKDAISAYDQWKAMVVTGEVDDPKTPGAKWPADAVEVNDFWRFLTGATGERGLSPHVGEDGNWWVGDKNLMTPARGEDAVAPEITIIDGNWAIDGKRTDHRAEAQDGKDGEDAKKVTLDISEDYYWMINGNKTEYLAIGKDGKTPEVFINDDGYWVIDGKVQKVRARAKDGADGADGKDSTAAGKSAYELWVEYIADGNVDNPHKKGEKWPKDRNTLIDFWVFLSSKDWSDQVQK